MNFNHDTGTIDTIQVIDTSSLPPLGGTAGLLTLNGVGGLYLNGGTTLQRPVGALGMIRFNTDLGILEAHNGTSWLNILQQGTVTSIAAAVGTGLTSVGGPITSSGTITLGLSAELQGLSAVSTNGIVARTAAGTYTSRTIAGTAGNIVVTNGDGVAAAPTVNLAVIGTAITSGDSTHTSALSVDTFGRVTAATATAIAFPVTSVFGRTGVISAVAGDYTLGQIGTVSLSAPAAGQLLTYNGSNWINAAPATNGTVTSIAVTGSTGLAVTGSPITSSGTIALTLGTELQGLSGLSAAGLVTRTGAGTYTSRVLTGTANQIVVTNGDGVAGAPTIALSTVTVGSTGTAFQKFSYDAYGRIANATAVVSTDISTLVDSRYLQLSGGTMTGGINLGGNTLTNVPTPVAGTDAANKNYVDASVAGLSWKQEVRVATTAAGTLATSFAAGQVVDGVTLVAGDRILIKNQATGSENGIYVVTAGAPTRATDSSTGAEVVAESVYVDQGTANAVTGWVQTVAAPITIGTTALAYAQFSGSGTYVAGTGLSLTGNTFSLNVVSTALGGTGLTAIGAANTVLGVNAGATGLEYKAQTAGTGISITNAAGSVTFANTGVLSFTQTLPSFLTQAGATTATGAVTSAVTLTSQAAGTVFAAPTGAAGAPTFRAIVVSDLPIKLYVENPSTPTAPLAAGANSVAIGSGASAPTASSYAVGKGSLTPFAGAQAYANGQFASAGDAQNLMFVLSNITTSATTTDLFVDGVTATVRPVLPNNSVWTFSIILSARRTDATGGGSGYLFEGVIKKDSTAASTTLVGTPAKTVLGETNSAWDVNVTADVTNGALKVSVTGEAAKTIRWVASVQAVQVTN